MSAVSDSVPASPYAAILSWSQTIPSWQRDALRRIVLSEPLDTEALQQLSAICRARHGLTPEGQTAPVAVPFAQSAVPGGADGSASVSLIKLSGLCNVGRLPSDQEIVFGPSPGLTVIYGENGAGKSGYARVIKKACRARGPAQTIKADVYAKTLPGPAKAKIEAKVGTVPTPVDWTDGGQTDARLSNIFVFDSASATAYVGKEDKASFKPRGLDVLPKLADICDYIKDELQEEVNAINADITKAAAGWRYNPETLIGKAISKLSAQTDPAKVDVAAEFAAADEERLAEIIAALNNDPKKKSAETSDRAKRVRAFAHALNSLATSLDDSQMQRLGEAIREADATAKAAIAAKSLERKDSDFPGSGDPVWRKLWDAAEAFSLQHAYPGQTFPVMDEDAKCVLCQQPLDNEAKNRFARFNQFVANQTRKQAETSKAAVTELKRGVDALRAIAPEAETVRVVLEQEAPDAFLAISAFVKALDTRLVHAKACLASGVWTDVVPLPELPHANLQTLAAKLDARSAEEASVANPEQAKKLTDERDQLVDKKWLAANKDEVKAQIARLARVAKLAACQNDCLSLPVSAQAKKLDSAYITDAFCKAFEAEREALGLRTLPVSLVSTGVTKGETNFALRLANAPKAIVAEVASEGEHRCIALAACLADLTQASHKSALVFDDPVSSLDRLRRAHVAKRLVKEASERQVVVFTHDVVFLCELFDATDGDTTAVQYAHLFWNGNTPGYCDSGLPWDWKKYTERIDALEKEQRALASSWSTIPNPTDVKGMRAAYTHLSATLERVVQDVILNGVIGRYRGWVKVENIKEVVGFPESECAKLLEIDKRCSDVTSRHDPAAAKDAPVPDPAALLKDINELKVLIEQAKNRRKANKAPASVPNGAAVSEVKPAIARTSNA